MTDIVERLRATPNRPTVPIHLGDGSTPITGMGLGYNHEDDQLRAEAANDIERLLAGIGYIHLILFAGLSEARVSYVRRLCEKLVAGENIR